MTDDTDIERRIQELSKFSAVRYARERRSVAKELGLTVASLDRLIEHERKRSSKDREEFAFEEPVPWGKPVDGAALLDRIAALVRRHVVLDARGFEVGTAALWVLFSYCHDAFDTSPILAIESATPSCGKTTLLSIIGQVVHRGIMASNISPAAIYRFIESHRPTLLMDEADAWLRSRDGRSNEEARSVLDSGHTRAGAKVIRCEGDDLKAKAFSTWCPKVIALIGKLPATLQGRSIVIVLRRKLAKDRVKRLKLAHAAAELGEIKRQCLRWKRDNFAALKSWDADSTMPEGMNDRAFDNWRQLVAIADIAEQSRKQPPGPDAELWSVLGRVAARELSGVEREEPELIALLLADIHAYLEERDVDYVFSQELADHLGNLADQPWSEWGRQGRPITPVQVARQLANLGIKPGTIRVGERTAKGYTRAQFEDAWLRYPPNRSVTPSQPKLFNGLDANRSVTSLDGVTVRNAANSLIDQGCYGVTDQLRGDAARLPRIDCATCRNFKRISDETGECTEGHDDAAPGLPRACREYLPASSPEARGDTPGNGLDAGELGTKITH